MTFLEFLLLGFIMILCYKIQELNENHKEFKKDLNKINEALLHENIKLKKIQNYLGVEFEYSKEPRLIKKGKK